MVLVGDINEAPPVDEDVLALGDERLGQKAEALGRCRPCVRGVRLLRRWSVCDLEGGNQPLVAFFDQRDNPVCLNLWCFTGRRGKLAQMFFATSISFLWVWW